MVWLSADGETFEFCCGSGETALLRHSEESEQIVSVLA